MTDNNIEREDFIIPDFDFDVDEENLNNLEESYLKVEGGVNIDDLGVELITEEELEEIRLHEEAKQLKKEKKTEDRKKRNKEERTREEYRKSREQQSDTRSYDNRGESWANYQQELSQEDYLDLYQSSSESGYEEPSYDYYYSNQEEEEPPIIESRRTYSEDSSKSESTAREEIQKRIESGRESRDNYYKELERERESSWGSRSIETQIENTQDNYEKESRQTLQPSTDFNYSEREREQNKQSINHETTHNTIANTSREIEENSQGRSSESRRERVVLDNRETSNTQNSHLGATLETLSTKRNEYYSKTENTRDSIASLSVLQKGNGFVEQKSAEKNISSTKSSLKENYSTMNLVSMDSSITRISAGGDSSEVRKVNLESVMNGKSSDFKKLDSEVLLGERVVSQRRSYALRGIEKDLDGNLLTRKEVNAGKSITKGEVIKIGKNLAFDTSNKLATMVKNQARNSVDGDDTFRTAVKMKDNIETYKILVVHPFSTMILNRGVPSSVESLGKVLSQKRFLAIKDFTQEKRFISINSLSIARDKRISEISILEKQLKKGVGEKDVIMRRIGRKKATVELYNQKIKDLKILDKLKGFDGTKGAILVQRKQVRLKAIKRLPITILKQAILEAEDATLRQFSSLTRSIPVIKKAGVMIKYAGTPFVKGVGFVLKKGGNALLKTAAGKAVATSRLGRGVKISYKTTKNVAGNISSGAKLGTKIAMNPIKYAGKGMAAGGKILGKAAATKISALPNTNKIKRLSNLGKSGYRATKFIGTKFSNKLRNSLIGRVASFFKMNLLKVKAVFSAIASFIGGVVSLLSSVAFIIIIVFLLTALLTSVIMIEDPERNLAHLADELARQQQEFQDGVLEMANLADDKTNVIIHLPSETSSLDNRREILSMTAVYFGQDFSPPRNGSIWNAGDRWIGDGINDDVIRYMEALVKASHQKKVVNEIKLEMRDTLLGAYDKNIHPNGGRPLPETMVWKYLDGTTYTYDFYVRTDEEKVPYWSPWFQITPITEYPEDYSEYKTRSITKPNGEVWIERELEYTLPVDVFETQGFDVPEALEHNKTDGVVFKFNGEIYEAIESRETEINYMHIFVDVKRFDPIFDLDGAGNLYYNDRIGVAADKLFNYNLKDYSYINTSGLIAVGKYSWTGNEALELIKEIWASLSESEKSNLQSSYPTEFGKLTNTINSGSQWYSLRIDSQTNEFKSLIKEILVSLSGVEAQQKRHAEKVGKVFNYLKGKGILDEKVLLFFGEMTFRKGEASMNSGVYNTMITSYINSDKTLDTAKNLYDSIVRSSEDNSVNSRVDNNYKEISGMEGLRDNLSSVGQWMYPAENWYRITSPFGVRGPVRDPNGNVVSGGMHYGIDLAIPMNTPLVAAHDGVVVGSFFSNCGGNILEVKATDTITYRYGHLSSFAASVGQTVKAGQIIAFSGGAAGQGDRCTSGPHLHFEVREGGNTRANAINPETLINFRSGEGGTVVSGPVVIGKLYNRNPEWEGWTEDNREWAKNIYNQDWADLYGLYDHGTVGAESNSNFVGFINPAIGVDNVIDESRIEDFMKRLPTGMSTQQKNLVKNLLNGLGIVKYANNGLPTGPGLSGAQGGLGHPGLIEWAYLNIGSSVKGQFSTHEKLWSASKPLTQDEVKIGDISFQYSGETGAGGNISIYIGNGYWVSMANGGLEVNSYTTNTNFRSLANFR